MNRKKRYSISDVRHITHIVFDSIWQSGMMNRSQAYNWMAHVMGIPPENAHIGKLSYIQCIRLIKKVNRKKDYHGRA